VEESPIHYANIKSKANRFGPSSSKAGPDIVYDTDQGRAVAVVGSQHHRVPTYPRDGDSMCVG